MNNKISLSYENNKFSVVVNEKVIYTDTELINTFEKFKQSLKDNINNNEMPWELIESDMDEYGLESLEINAEYKNLVYKKIKYFHSTHTVFYMKNDMMSPLLGGYEFFKFVLSLVKNKSIENYEELLDLCAKLINKKILYRVDNMVLTLSNPKFNYGYIQYDFINCKMHKGTAISVCTFKEFEEYVMKIIE